MRIKPNRITIIIKFSYNNRKIGFVKKKRNKGWKREREHRSYTEEEKEEKRDSIGKIVEQPSIKGKGGVLTL